MRLTFQVSLKYGMYCVKRYGRRGRPFTRAAERRAQQKIGEGVAGIAPAATGWPCAFVVSCAVNSGWKVRLPMAPALAFCCQVRR